MISEQYKQVNSLGRTYYLNAQPVTLANGGKSVAYFFSKDPRPETALESVPEGREVFESPRSHILLLRRAKPTK